MLETKFSPTLLAVCSASFSVSAVAAPALLWELTDIIIALMAILNISALLASRRAVIEETRDYFENA